MKIAIFSDTFPPQIDGVSSVVFRSAVWLVKLGHKVTVFTISNGSNNKSDDRVMTQKGGFELIRIPSVPALVYPGYRLALPIGTIRKSLRSFQPDIIHTHTPFSIGWSAIRAAKLFHLPIVGTHHTFYEHYLKHLHLDFKLAKNFSWKYTVGYYNHCDLVLSPSKSLSQQLKRHGLKKPLQIFANAVETELFKPIANERSKKKLKKTRKINGQSLVYMGRLSYEKSVDQLIRATAEISKKIPQIKLMIIGDGSARAGLEDLVSKLKINNNVTFLGFRQNLELVEALQANDIFLTASKTENMPISVMEAMSTGLPIIAIDALGMPEIVKDNVNGFLVRADDWQAISDKTLELLNNEKLMDSFSAASRQESLRYSEETTVKSLEKIYQKLIKTK